MKKAEPSRRRTIWKRAGIATALLLAAAVAVPFLFTTSIVRHYLAKAGVQGVTIGSASLMPWGELRLHDVTFLENDQTGGGAGKTVLAAGTVRASFAWSELAAGKFQAITIDALSATARPGADTPVSLWRLFAGNPPAAAASAPSATPATGPSKAPSPAPLWFDSLTATGNLRVEGAPAWATAAALPANANLPLRISVKMTGDRQKPALEIAGNIGDVELAPTLPMIAARVHLTADDSQVTLDSVGLSNFTAAIDGGLLKKMGLAQPEVKGISSRLEGLKFAGKISLGADVAVSLTGELRDFSFRAAATDGTLAVDHLYADKMRVDGKWTAAAFAGESAASLFKDLTVAQTSCRCESVQAGDFRLNNVAADLVKDGAQVELTALEATVGNTALKASVAYDLNLHAPTQGFVRFNGIDAAAVAARLPENVRPAIPGDLDGKIAARLFLTGSDAEKYSLRLEIDAPDDLQLRAPAMALASTGPATQPLGPQRAALSNLTVRADLLWNPSAAGLPEISNGRITADQLDLHGPAGDSSMPLTRLRSDFSLSHGIFRGDVYADLPSGGLLAGEALYTVKTQTLENGSFSLDDLDASLFNKFLPAKWSLAGVEDVELQVSGTPAALKVAASLTTSPQNSVKYGNGTLAVTGAPTINLHGQLDATGRDWTIDSLIVQSVNAQADAAMVQTLADALGPQADSPLEQLLNRLKPGATLAFHDLTLNGHVQMVSGMADGSLTLGQFNLMTPAGAVEPFLLEDAGVSLAAKAPWNGADLVKNLVLSSGQVQLKKLTLGDQVIGDFSGLLQVAGGKATATDLKFKYAQAAFTGTAQSSLGSGFDRINLHFAGLDQAIVTAHLAPDKFKAEGPVSGELTLRQGTHGLSGEITLDSDQPGKLLISRAVSTQYFAPAAKQMAAASGGMLPANFDQLIVDILANYPYTVGHVVVHDGTNGMDIDLNYTRQPLVAGDPGWKVPVVIGGQQIPGNLQLNLNSTIHIPEKSVLDEIQQLLGGGIEVIGVKN